MRPRAARLVTAGVLAVALGVPLAPTASAAETAPSAPAGYLVQTATDGQTRAAAESVGVEPKVTFDSVVHGFAADLTPAQATELRDRILGLLEAAEEDEGPEAEQVVFQTHTFPLPGRVGPTEEEEEDGS